MPRTNTLAYLEYSSIKDVKGFITFSTDDHVIKLLRLKFMIVRKKLECLPLDKPFQAREMFVGKARSLP
jgi:hypothetical protein